MPICPLLSDFRTCYADIVAERWAQGPGRGRRSSHDQNPAGDAKGATGRVPDCTTVHSGAAAISSTNSRSGCTLGSVAPRICRDYYATSALNSGPHYLNRAGVVTGRTRRVVA